MKKFIFVALAVGALCSVAQAEAFKQPYVAVCIDGKIAAQPKEAKWPVRTLWLLIEGVRAVPCVMGNTIEFAQLSEPSVGENGEGLSLVGSASFQTGNNGATFRTMVISTFQERRVPRRKAGQSI